MMEKPNILIIMCDQMTPFLTGAYGHSVVKTPNLDKLVAEGIRFDNAYTSCPVCSPARASFMTGKHISSINAYDNASPMPSDEPTFAHYLTNEGYDVVLSGKMHFIGPDQLHGFNRRLTTDIYPSGFDWTTTRNENIRFSHGDGSSPIAIDYVTAGTRQWSMQLEYDEETHFRGMEYIYSRRMQPGGSLQRPLKQREPNPFCLCVSYTHPHEPFHATQELWDIYENELIDLPEFPDNVKANLSQMDRWLNALHGVDQVDLCNKANLYAMRRAYYSLVTYVDNKVGELLKALESTGLSDNTIVIFVSDHGEMLGEKGMVQKRTFYEWSSRIPLIVRFPDHRNKGTKCAEPVSIMDIAPTLLELAGVQEYGPMDGENLMRFIEGGNADKRAVFSEYHSEGVYAPCFMVRFEDYKYIYIHGKESQLFDVKRDPGEWHNLSGDLRYEQMETKMKKLIFSRFDPDKIETDIRESIKKRHVIRKAMKLSGTKWDYFPYFNATKQYWRVED